MSLLLVKYRDVGSNFTLEGLLLVTIASVRDRDPHIGELGAHLQISEAPVETNFLAN